MRKNKFIGAATMVTGMVIASTAYAATQLVGTLCPCTADAWGYAAHLFPDMDSGNASAFKVRGPFPDSAPAAAIQITEQGMYRITGQQLLDAGFPADRLVGAALRLSHRGETIAFHVSTEGPFSPTDHLMFYARGFRGLHTDTSVYWIGLGDGGQRWTPIHRPTLPGLSEITQTTHFEVIDTDRYFIPLYRPYDDAFDHWFSEVFNSSSATGITIPTPHPVTGSAPKLHLRLAEKDATTVSQPTRTLDIRHSGSVIASPTFKGNGMTPLVVSLSASHLNNPSTTFTFQTRPAGLTLTAAYLHDLVVEYARHLRTTNGIASFALPAGVGNVHLTGPTSETGYLLDVTIPSRPRRIHNTLLDADRLAFLHASKGRACYFYADESAIRTAQLSPVASSSSLADTDNQADLIVVAPSSFHAALDPLVQHRRNQGLSVRVIDPNDIWHSFGYGLKDPAALRQFLGVAYHHWSAPAPRYVMLVGDASFDPRNRTGNAPPDILMTRMGKASFEWAATDAWFAWVDQEDSLPDMAIGRVPVQTTAQLTAWVQKVLAFENAVPSASWRSRALLAADDIDAAGNFKARSEALRTSWFSGMNVTTAYLDDLPGATVRTRILDGFNNGSRIVNYVGHGSDNRWANFTGGNLFQSADVASLTATVYPIVSVWACQTGQFPGHPFNTTGDSLAEVLIRQTRGASAVIAASSEALEVSSGEIAHGFYDALLSRRTYRLGDAFRAGLQRLHAFNDAAPELQFYTLFGDPSQVVQAVINPAADSDGDGMTDGWEAAHGLDPFSNDAHLDPDQDGLSNLREFLANTHPLRSDTDGDGLPDGIELALGLNPLAPISLPDGIPDYNRVFPPRPHATLSTTGVMGSADLDGDGLAWDTEIAIGTNPLLADTDGDGLSDGAEVLIHGTHPLNPDSDGDGLSDGVEIFHGTNPLSPDTDQDGLDDATEVALGTHPLIADSHLDPDGDGLTTMEEWFHGTNPLAWDTDGDGLSDGAELRIHFTNPLKVDTDADGVSDGREVLVLGSNPLVKDSDTDGLSDLLEDQYGTNPNASDTDGDGMTDLYEIQNGLNPLINDAHLDRDGDGLTNLEEFILGTRADRVDTDNDGLSDYDEVNQHGTNPKLWDTDGDTASDGQEIAAGTNPLVWDTDGDGMRDGWEINNGLNPLINDADDDPDGDGVPNWEEHLHFTNPQVTDTDGDGLSDRFEIDNAMVPRLRDRDRDGLTDGEELLIYGTDPSKADTDGDGLSDFAEVRIYGTNPLLPDTDGDGASDFIEIQLGLDPLRNDMHEDPDNDGLTNAQEIARGTKPFIADTDGDGLSDGSEIARGTNPLSTDTDGDGLSDGLEVALGTNPLSADTDGDGLPDAWEHAHGTNPLIADAHADPDGDGLPNFLEFFHSTHPLVPDTDGDGLNDLLEILLGTNPLHPDSDDDGLNDFWEWTHGLNPLQPEQDMDPDRDGHTHAQEAAAGTLPNDPESVLSIRVRIDEFGPILEWPSVQHRTYRITVRDPLNPANATPVSPVLPATPPLNSWPIPSPLSPSACFEVQLEPHPQ